MNAEYSQPSGGSPVWLFDGDADTDDDDDSVALLEGVCEGLVVGDAVSDALELTELVPVADLDEPKLWLAVVRTYDHASVIGPAWPL